MCVRQLRQASGKLFRGVCKRLLEVGFAQARPVNEAYGVTAVAASERQARQEEVAMAYELQRWQDEAEFGEIT